MKAKSNFVLRHIASKYMLVPLGEECERFYGVIDINETGAFIWERLKTEQTVESIAAALLEEYEVTEAEALECVKEYTALLEKSGFLE